MRAPLSRPPVAAYPNAPAIEGIINGMIGALALWAAIAAVILALA
ncbi:hypothetical protein QE385_003722 [Sphingomonas sp. SORGH_AS 950]|nr:MULTISPECIES: hypothetical protein [unclassified Sphingomonas]MDQ1159395.1 hypothetical protein [Sphingomonas sp. SORGH_AS_0950]MDR6145914.1 hypothetical protein [Sphingomonas sp. SORGH_AS_0870]